MPRALQAELLERGALQRLDRGQRHFEAGPGFEIGDLVGQSIGGPTEEPAIIDHAAPALWKIERGRGSDGEQVRDHRARETPVLSARTSDYLGLHLAERIFHAF